MTPVSKAVIGTTNGRGDIQARLISSYILFSTQ